MRLISILVLLTVTLEPFAFALQNSNGAAPVKLLGPAVCGKGTYVLTHAGQSAGRETFEVSCKPDGGYLATGRTELNVGGASSDLVTTLELDKAGLPISSTAKGSINGQPFEQSVSIKDDTAAVITGTKQRELPYAKGTALLGGNIFYMFQFVAAMYDTSRGGVQTISIFPSQTARIERIGQDRVRSSASQNVVSFDRYSITLGLVGLYLWFDQQGRLAVISVPSQSFSAAREEYEGLVDSLTKLLADPASAKIDYTAPPSAPFTAEEVTVQAKGFTLGGTLLLPKTGKRPFAAAITITGSGQQTRDERLPIPGLEKYRPFGQIAEALAAAGIAVLRVDDRGVGRSNGKDTLAAATSADFADDTRAQIDYLRSRPEIDGNRIALIGHSEGGVIAPMIAATDTRIAAIVLMAGTAKRGDEILTFQYGDALKKDPTISPEALDKMISERRAMLTSIAEGHDDQTTPAAMRSGWMKYFIAYDPLPTIKRVRQPILVLQGGLDHQVTPDQAPMIKKAAHEAGNKDVTVKLYPRLNHLFLPAQTGEPSEYSTLSTTQLGDDVIQPLVEWLKLKLRVRD
jgi:dienelactone hydrolase